MTTKLFEYLEGDLSTDERITFERKISRNPKLEETVSLYDDVNKFLEKDADIERLKLQIGELHHNYENHIDAKQRLIVWVKRCSVAASILLIVGFGGFYTLYNDSPSSIYNSNYMAWEPKNVTRGNLNRTELADWLLLYENKAYREAIDQFELLPQAIKEQPQVILMYSCALMQQDDYKKALGILAAFKLDGYSFFIDDFEWFTALNYLMLEEVDKAENSFNKLISSKKYGERAEKALKKLD